MAAVPSPARPAPPHKFAARLRLLDRLSQGDSKCATVQFLRVVHRQAAAVPPLRQIL